MSPSFFKPLVACLMVLLSALVQGQIGIIIGTSHPLKYDSVLLPSTLGLPLQSLMNVRRIH